MNAEPSLQITIGATEARSHFADLLKRVHRGKEHLIVEKGGIPVAAIIGMREYDDFLRWRAQQAARTLGVALDEQAARVGIDEERLTVLLEEDRQALYDERYGDRATP
jgi:prevent-host-death family protein